MPNAAFTVRVVPVDASAPLARDDAQPRRFVVTRLTSKQEARHPECVQVPFMNKADVSDATPASSYLQVWEFDHFNEGVYLERMETQAGGRGDRCLVVVPGVVARTVEGKKVSYEFLAVGAPEILPAQNDDEIIGPMALSLDHADQTTKSNSFDIGEYESFYELAAVLRPTSGGRSFAPHTNAVPHILRNVTGSVLRQARERAGFAIAFVSDYPASSKKGNREFANQAEEMLATLPTFRLEGGTLTVGHHLITHWNQMAASMRDVRQAVEQLLSEKAQVCASPKVAVLEIYAHGEPYATNTNPTSWRAGGGTLRKNDVRDFVTQIRDHLTDDVVVSLFACHNGRSPSAIDRSLSKKGQRFADKMFGRPYPCEELGNDSIAWWLHRELVRQGKPWATVYAHTTAGHTTRNHFLRVFSRWGSSDLVNLLAGARRIPPARLAQYKRETAPSGIKPKNPRYYPRLRNANRLRTLSTISAKYYAYGWCNGSNEPADGESQRSDGIVVERLEAASPLADLVNGSSDVVPDELVYEAADRAYIRGLVPGNTDADLSEHFTYGAIAATGRPLRLSVQLMKYVQMLRYRTAKPMTPVRVVEDGNRLVVRVAAAHAAAVEDAAKEMVTLGLFSAAARTGNEIQLDLHAPCPCPEPKENFPYSAETFAMVKSIKDLVVTYAKHYDVPPVAVAGAIADEYNTRTGLKGVVDWFQDDVLLNFLPNFAIELDVFIGSDSKLLNSTKHDIGKGNIKLETAKQLYDMFPGAFAKKNWDYTDLVDYLRTDEGTVHLSSLVILRARQLLDPYLTVYSDKRREAVYITYYKQGPGYIKRYQDALAADPNRLISPGEGCRVCRQRDKMLEALGLK